jgi:cytochrome c biogenesis protein ResB
LSESQPSAGGQPPAEITAGDIGRAGWRRLREMRTVFQLLFLIAAGTLICAVVPQNLPAEEYYQRYGRFLANLITRLQLDHVQTAGWFLLLLALLMLSLVACSGRLWKEASARWRLPAAAAAQQRLKSAARQGQAALAVPEAMAAVEATARRHGYRHFPVAQDADRSIVYLCKHRFSAWGLALAHYAVFLIALGALLGALPGLSLDQQVEIAEGETYHAEDGSLPFDLRVDKFSIIRREGSEDVENYYSDVAVLDDGQEVSRTQISVNHPLRYRGYFVSQSSWGLGEAHVEVTAGGKTTPLSFPLARTAQMGMGEGAWGIPPQGAAAFLPGGDAAFVGTGFFCDAIEKDGKIQGRPTEYLGRPALNITYVSGLPGQQGGHGEKDEDGGGHGLVDLGWVFPGQSLPFKGGSVKFVGVSQTTGLGIRKDSGLLLVWAGFIACMVGLALIFYVPLQRSVVQCEPRGQGRATIRMSPYGRAHELAQDDVWSDLLAAVNGKPVSGAAAEEDGS